VEPPPERPAPPRTTEPAPDRPATPAPDPAALLLKDQAAIRGTLTQFQNAYANRDAAAVRRVWPSAPNNLQAALSAARSYRVDIQNPQIAVQGDTATVTATRVIRVQPEAGRPLEQSQPTTFSLRRVPNGWIIDAVR
jgi:ketosteroid isomerase-like protein